MKKLSDTVKIFLLSLLIVTLTSCGFHLRGSTPLPKELETLYIESSEPYGDFEQILREVLRTYKVNIVKTAKQAPLTLNIIQAKLQQSTGAVSGDLTMRQYTLSYVVKYEVIARNGTILIPPETVQTNTTFTANMNQMMTSSNNTTAQYLPGLQRDAVSRMIYRLTSDNSHTVLQKYFDKVKT